MASGPGTAPSSEGNERPPVASDTPLANQASDEKVVAGAGVKSPRKSRGWLARDWPAYLVVVAALGVGIFHVVVHYQTREEPNYPRIEEGLYLGGYVDSPAR